ncbi:MAG TPA: right-handed parallel beta-helix repeat-containing protein [Phycisphaerae bacterium]|nr:right-handed parallel beta-helix repeat-containing protein [Phycisphaerae bacterium]
MSGVLSHRVLVVLLIGVLAAAGDAYAQTTWYVDDNCPGSGSGTMGDPFCTIQEGITAAVNGDTVLVLDGEYNEAIDLGGKVITVRSSGGAAVTTIDATGLSASVVMCVSGEGADTVLEGFTITGGIGTVFGGYLYGGGMCNWYSSSPTVTQCTFSGNTADGFGGGMDNWASSPTVTHCTFSGNTADGGGGMFNSASSPTVTHCTFSGNTAAFGNSGGMYNWDNSSPTVTDCTFSGNTAEEWGGGMGNEDSSPTVTHCTFSGNSADRGGGVYNDGSSPTVTDCSFSTNDAPRGGGGGMYNKNGSSPTVTDCAFSGNSAIESGGGMYNVGSSPTVTQCTFSGNTGADWGGGMYNHYNSSPTVTQCTFSGNTSRFNGGGMANDSNSSPTVSNCILWNDTPNEIYNDDPNSVPTVTFSDVQGGTAQPWFGSGCLDDDPLFADADGSDDTFGTDDDNLRLADGSPCIDAGDNAAVPPGLTTDLDGNPRISHGTVDMGAYERQDDDGDGVIDEADNCPDISNADQQDTDGDEVGDACDACLDTAAGDPVDAAGCSTDDDDGDGVPNDADDCPDTPSCATNIDADGCAIDSDDDGVVDGCPVTPQVLDDDGDGVPNDEDACPNTPAGAAVDASGCPAGCCGASGPVAPLGLAVGMLLLSRFAGYRGVRRRR